VFFDGTRLGLEATMLAVLATVVPSGLHLGLSSAMGQLARYAPDTASPIEGFSPFGFVFASLLGMLGLSVLMFFVEAIPTMACSMGLVSLVLHWPRQWRGQERRVSTVVGTVVGLIIGLLVAAGGFALLGLSLSRDLYGSLFRWPAILSIDGIATLWLTLTPLVHSVAGAQLGINLGKQMEEYLLYRFW
jgi:hypothetical protein